MSGGGGPLGQIGGIFNFLGEQEAMRAEINATEANANWFYEQAEFARQSTVRELKIFDRESEEFYGEQVSGIARGGLDLSGSPLLVLASTKLREYEEREAIKEMGAMQYKEASLRGDIASSEARSLRYAKKLHGVSGAIGIYGGAMSGGFKASKGGY